MKSYIVLIGAALCAVPTFAQNGLQQRASIRGGGNPNEGKCTIEVVVDGAADLEVRGDVGTLRNLSGQQPQWRRFECTGRMPDNPAQFRVRGIDGRGRVQMIQDPRNGGSAVVRIEDPSGGREGYTLDLEWGGGRFDNNGPIPPRQGDRPGDFREDRDRIGGGPFSAERAVRFCEQAVRQQAEQRLGSGDIQFLNTRIDDNPGRRDWVIGTFSVRRPGRDDTHRFSCSVDLSDAHVRNVEIDSGGGGSRFPANNAVQTCRTAVEERIHRQGYNRVEIGRIDVDNGPGRNDWVIGNARGERGNRSTRFEFSCRVNLNSGVVRSVNLQQR